MISETDLAERILVGIGCGDSLGKMTSKYSKEQVRNVYGGKVMTLGKPIIKRSKRIWEIGDVTDDTILTLLVIDSIISERCFNRSDIGRRLIQCPDPKGGRQIYKLKESRNPNFIAEDGYTNGPAIRIAGISIVFSRDESLYKHLIDSCTLTHIGNESLLGTLLVGHVYSEIIKGKKGIDILHTVLPDLECLRTKYFPNLANSKVIKNLEEALKIAKRSKIEELCNLLELNIGMNEYPCSSLVSATVIGLSYNNPRDCLIDTINRLNEGGDLDSTAAIAGGVCAGLNGYEKISDWRKIIEQRNSFCFKSYANKLIGVKNDRYCCI